MKYNFKLFLAGYSFVISEQKSTEKEEEKGKLFCEAVKS